MCVCVLGGKRAVSAVVYLQPQGSRILSFFLLANSIDIYILTENS